MKPLVRALGSVAASRRPIGVVDLFRAFAIAPASATERVQGQVSGTDAAIAIE